MLLLPHPLADFGLANYSSHRWRVHRLWVGFHDVRLRHFVQDLSTSRNGEGGSEQIREGAQIFRKPLTDDVERFLSMLRFDSREK
jgi:hypothetical protein